MSELGPVNMAIRARRVTRAMTSDPLPIEAMDTILRSAHFAPNAGNRRIHHPIPVEDRRLLEMIRAVSPGMIPAPRAVIVIAIDVARAADFGFNERAPGLFVDVGMLAATIMLSAFEEGVGSCPVTSFSKAAVSRLLDLPVDFLPWMLLCLGMPAMEQPRAMTTTTAHGR